MNGPEIHDAVRPLATLLGTWRGEGKGEYPTIAPFSYIEEITFRHVGKPFLIYEQRTRHPQTGAPMHAETGYWRVVAPGRLEVVLAHPTGVVEIEEGSFTEGRIEIATTTVAGTSTAKPVEALARAFALDGDVLRYELRMAAVGQPLQHHLAAELRRVP